MNFASAEPTWHQPLSAAGWHHTYSGKVRDLWRHPDLPGEILLVASDRISAFDHVLRPEIAGKGATLTALTRWWFSQFPDVTNHLSASDSEKLPTAVADRGMLVRELRMHPIECVVRGYLTGSGWKEYRESGTVCGIPLPGGLADGDRLPKPLFTPAWKAPQGEHDQNISFDAVAEIVGAQAATQLQERSVEIFVRASEIAAARGVILADTKFEFGVGDSGELVLADEVLTSDSSRFWDAAAYAEGRRAVSWDKQIVRDWLAANWDGTGSPPTLPESIVERTAERYRELLARLTT